MQRRRADERLWYRDSASGGAYAGIYQFDGVSSKWREYLRVDLTSPLVAGTIYRVSFHVSLAEGSPTSGGKIGAIVGENIPLSTSWVHPIRPQDKYVQAFDVIRQTSGWLEVHGDFIATGGENTIVIGFFEDTLSNVQNNPQWTGCVAGWPQGSSFYYVDDVALVESPCATIGNLVPNPSFECKLRCPGIPGFFNAGASFFDYVVAYWFNGHDPSSNLGTPDYYNACDAKNCSSGTPSNANGTETPRTGQAYAGIAQYHYDSGWREYIRAPLIASLQPNRRYVLKFYVSEAEMSAFSAGRVGAIVGRDIPRATTRIHPIGPLDHYVEAHDIISRRNGWELVRGEFTARGKENNIVIGFFNLDTIQYAPPDTNLCRFYIQGTNYLYIDDVSLQDCCDGLTVTAEPTEDPCNWTIRVSQNPELQCIYGVEVVGGTSCYDDRDSTSPPLQLASGLPVGSIQLSTPGKQTVIVRFLDLHKKEICVQTVEVECMQKLK